MKNDEMTLQLDESTVRVSFDGRYLRIDDRKVTPTRSSLDIRRVVPFWVGVVAALSLGLAGMVFGALLGRVDLAIISTASGFGVGAVVFMALSRMEQVLEVDAKEGSYTFRGPVDDLRVLYYEISKLTIKRLKEKEREEAVPMKGAGIFKGDSLLGKKDAGSVRGDLKRTVVMGKRMVAQICPDCGNDELYYEGGFMTGHVYHCKRCDYVGSFVIEKELDLK